MLHVLQGYPFPAERDSSVGTHSPPAPLRPAKKQGRSSGTPCVKQPLNKDKQQINSPTRRGGRRIPARYQPVTAQAQKLSWSEHEFVFLYKDVFPIHNSQCQT